MRNKDAADRNGAPKPQSPFKQRARRAIENLISPVVERASRRYVAGETLADAQRVGAELAAQRYDLTLCLWPVAGAGPRAVADGCLEALDAGVASADWHLSVKPPDLGYSPELLAEVARRARQAGVHLHFDAHGPETADPTFALVDPVLAEGCDVGVTLPGRWRRSLGDAARAAARGLRVRVVKGQWKDPEEPDRDERRGFLEVIERLAGRTRHVAVACHDPAVTEPALERLRRAGTPCELQLLYGLQPGPALEIARRHGVTVRFYVGYGQGWLPYCAVQLVKNPRIGLRLLRDAVAPRSPAVPAKE